MTGRPRRSCREGQERETEQEPARPEPSRLACPAQSIRPAWVKFYPHPKTAERAEKPASMPCDLAPVVLPSPLGYLSPELALAMALKSRPGITSEPES